MQVPAPFDYARASSIDEAIAMLERLGPEARLVAGGHSLLPMMKLRLATPEHLIDINPLEAELGYIQERDGEVRIGALTRHRDILESELLARHFAIIRDAEEKIADPPCATAARSAARSAKPTRPRISTPSAPRSTPSP